MKVTCNIDMGGVEEALERIGPTLAKKYLRKAMKAAMKPIEEQAISLVPVDTGALRESLMTKVKMSGSQDRGIAIFGPAYDTTLSKKGKDTSQDPGVYGKWVEFGVSSRKYKKTPFMRPAFDSQAENAIKKFAEVLQDGLAEVVK